MIKIAKMQNHISAVDVYHHLDRNLFDSILLKSHIDTMIYSLNLHGL